MRVCFRRCGLLVAFLCLFCNMAFALSDVPPSSPDLAGGYYLSARTAQLGNVSIFFPSSVASSLYLTSDESKVVNLSNSAVTGYILGSDYEPEYSVRFTAWSSDAEYRVYTSSSWSDWNPLTIQSLTASNIDFQSYSEQSRPAELWPLLICGLLVLVVIVCFMRR